MKLTTARLRQIIKEELKKINETNWEDRSTLDGWQKMQQQIEGMSQDTAIELLSKIAEREELGPLTKRHKLYAILVKQKLDIDLSAEEEDMLRQQKYVAQNWEDFLARNPTSRPAMIRKAKATNLEPEFQTNPDLEESKKRRTKRK